MSSPFMASEPVTFDKKPEQQQEVAQEKEVKQNEQIVIPNEIKGVINEYQKVIQDPSNLDNLWEFVKTFLTSLESKENLVKPLISENSNQNLMLTIKENSMVNIPWGVYNCFLTLSNIGSKIAEKKSKDDRDRFYLIYVMLSVNDDSPTYSFTELLQTLQSQDENTKKTYNELNEKFLEAFKKYEEKPQTICMPNIEKKWIYIIVTILLIIIVGSGIYFYTCKNGKNTPLVVAAVTDNDSIISDF